jgi:hypothetical protein
MENIVEVLRKYGLLIKEKKMKYLQEHGVVVNIIFKIEILILNIKLYLKK